MRTDTSPGQTPTRLSDYRSPDWLVERVRLTFDLAPSATRVRAKIAFRRNPARADEGPADLRLDGRKLTFVAAEIDGTPLVAGETVLTDAEGLTVPATALPGTAFEWDCEVEVDPSTNSELEGLYLSKGMYCTQCEAEGFREITYYLDRPDVMAPFSVRIEAPADVPVLLSNGNPGRTGALPDGRHFAEWEDPHPKPAYLFALVAGDLVSHDDRFKTMEDRDVALRLWVRPGDETKCAYAMDALKRSMRWDEEAYGRAYDLDVFQIVAVDDFNMGAMENKGLNIFNSKYVLASPETATDTDYERIESIVAHEYFHNWTGNRITCRDWFQLCLKEGLTVFRDQQFSADMRSAPVQRIGDVQALRARQFPEDAGPLAHPVRPEEYIEINNFYTATVYEKGAEVIRMLHTLVGPENYRAALDLYFERYDGEATTIEAFFDCFLETCISPEVVRGRLLAGVHYMFDLDQFRRWWSQAGTPRVAIDFSFDGASIVVKATQRTDPTPGQPEKAPLVIPLALAAFDETGAERWSTVMVMHEETGGGIIQHAINPPAERLVFSVNRGFAAPVVIDREISDADRAFLLAHDTDPFARWEAGNRYGIDVALTLVRDGGDVPEAWSTALGALLTDESLDPAFRARALAMPGEDMLAGEIAQAGGKADPTAIHAAVRAMRAALGSRLGAPLATSYEAMAVPGPYSPDAESAGRRALRNRCLGLLMASDCNEAARAAESQFDGADNMTDAMAALAALTHQDAPGAGPRLAAFHARWQDDPLVLDKWFSVQATAPVPDALARVEALTDVSSFDWTNPNRFRSLVGAFAMGNPVAFHAEDGSGYRFLADWLLRLDAKNPQTAARLCGAFESWRRYTEDRQRLMTAALRRMAGDGLSRNSREIVERILGTA